MGSDVPADRLAQALLAPTFDRDGITIASGEPFHQPQGLWALIQQLRTRGCQHILCYSGYTYERLRRMAQRQPAIAAILDEINVLIDGLYMQALAKSAGPWTGSGNQRVIDLVETRRVGRVALWQEHSVHVLPGPPLRPGTHGKSVGKNARPNFPVNREAAS